MLAALKALLTGLSGVHREVTPALLRPPTEHTLTRHEIQEREDRVEFCDLDSWFIPPQHFTPEESAASKLAYDNWIASLPIEFTKQQVLTIREEVDRLTKVLNAKNIRLTFDL